MIDEHVKPSQIVLTLLSIDTCGVTVDTCGVTVEDRN